MRKSHKSLPQIVKPINTNLKLGNRICSRHQRGMKRPLLVVVPWLEDGGADHLMLDILKGYYRTFSITLVTTCKSRHPLRRPAMKYVNRILHWENLKLKEFNRRLTCMLKRSPPHVVISSGSKIFYRSLPLVKMLWPSLPVVDILHNSLRAGHFSQAVADSDYITKHVVVSGHIKKDLLGCGIPARKILCIPNGIAYSPSDAKLRNGVKTAKRTSGAKFIPKTNLLFVGRASSEKRPKLFVDVCKHLNKQYNVKAVCISSGPLAKDLHRYVVRTGMSGSIRIVASVPRRRLPMYYRGADILVNTSSVEGLPLTVLEAMACGCPTACFAVGGMPSVIKNNVNGLVVKGHSARRMAGFLAELLCNQSRCSRMRRAASRVFQERGFTVEVMQKRYNDLLEKVTNDGNK
jgi:glycosyltransferase involved in cell wall biosynthesis